MEVDIQEKSDVPIKTIFLYTKLKPEQKEMVLPDTIKFLLWMSL